MNNLNALIIDDEQDICLLLSGILGQMGVHGNYAMNLTEGLLKITHGNFDVLFLDINLPDGSGLEALPKIKQIDPNLKIIMISAYDGESERNEGFRKGISAFIGKPLSKLKIKEALQKLN